MPGWAVLREAAPSGGSALSSPESGLLRWLSRCTGRKPGSSSPHTHHADTQAKRVCLRFSICLFSKLGSSGLYSSGRHSFRSSRGGRGRVLQTPFCENILNYCMAVSYRGAIHVPTSMEACGCPLLNFVFVEETRFSVWTARPTRMSDSVIQMLRSRCTSQPAFFARKHRDGRALSMGVLLCLRRRLGHSASIRAVGPSPHASCSGPKKYGRTLSRTVLFLPPHVKRHLDREPGRFLFVFLLGVSIVDVHALLMNAA